MGLMKEILKPSFGGNFGAARGETASVIQQHGDGDITVSTHQEVDHILKANRDLQNDDHYDGKFQGDDWGKRVARVPFVVFLKWRREGKADFTKPEDMPKIMQLLDDPEYAHLKVVPEKVSRYGTGRSYFRASSGSSEIIPAFTMPGEKSSG